MRSRACGRLQDSILEFTAQEEASASDADGFQERAAPALLTSTRWSSRLDAEAVLLQPAEVRETWHTFKQVRSPGLAMALLWQSADATWTSPLFAVLRAADQFPESRQSCVHVLSRW